LETSSTISLKPGTGLLKSSLRASGLDISQLLTQVPLTLCLKEGCTGSAQRTGTSRPCAYLRTLCFRGTNSLAFLDISDRLLVRRHVRSKGSGSRHGTGFEPCLNLTCLIPRRKLTGLELGLVTHGLIARTHRTSLIVRTELTRPISCLELSGTIIRADSTGLELTSDIHARRHLPVAHLSGDVRGHAQLFRTLKTGNASLGSGLFRGELRETLTAIRLIRTRTLEESSLENLFEVRLYISR
jgi:hypothetical protein